MNTFYEDLGLTTDTVWNIDSPASFLIQESVRKGQGKLDKNGALVVETGKHTGRSANDRYIVKSKTTADNVWWENNLNEMAPETFSKIQKKILAYLNEHKELFITERSVGAHETHNIGARLVTTHAHNALFSQHMFRDKIRDFNDTDFVILHAPELVLDAEEFGLKSGTVVATCFDTNTTLIAGTRYAGEIKKSMFSVMNYRLPEIGILPMHAGANRLDNKESGIFFGLSGTGKTTLSTDMGTMLIGDDEHGLSDEGIFNFEGGCYAKTYKLTRDGEPEIFHASERFGALLENVVMDESNGEVDFFDKTLSENGRLSYPLNFIDELEKTSQGKIPSHIFFLSADAFGVLPPVAQLTKEQAMFYFVLGYTAKLAGTEIGIKEPQATFSPCFGAPFMLRHPSVYAKLLGEYLEKNDIKVWLINTGWTGGAYGEGERFPLKVTRKIIRSIQANTLNDTQTESDPIFGFNIPVNIDGVEADLLHPQKTWTDTAAYSKVAEDLAVSFHTQMKNFGGFYQENIDGAPKHNA